MIRINQELCIGCGACVRDCTAFNLKVENGKAECVNRRCIQCGHCYAVCPVKAITLEDENYDMSEVLEFKDIEREIDPEAYLNHLKGRRSIRQFTDKAVTKEQIELLLDAGRFSPTGGNRQTVSYFVCQDDIENFKDMLYDQLKVLGESDYLYDKDAAHYNKQWLWMYDLYKKKGIDRLFFGGKTAIVISSNTPQSAIIAAAHMETLIYAMGLGMVYSGFSKGAINSSEKLQKYIEQKEYYEVWAVLVIGEPDVAYERTVSRKPAVVTWK